MFRRQLALVAATAFAAGTLGSRIARAEDDPWKPPPPPVGDSSSGTDATQAQPAQPPAQPPDHDSALDHDASQSRTPSKDDQSHDATIEDGHDAGDSTVYSPRLVNSSKDIVIETPGERSSKNIAMLSTVGGAALVGGIFGLYFHLEGKKAADAVTQTQFNSRTWSPAYQSDVDKSAHDRRLAIGFYAGGSVLLIAAVVALIVTDPKSTTTTIHPHAAMVVPVPVPGGAVLARGWEF
jgi:hypothetical protein